MAPSTVTSPRNLALDLRSPATASLRRGLALDGLRVLTLILLDAIILTLVLQLAETQIDYLDIAWSSKTTLASLLPLGATMVGFIAARGLYGSGSKRRDYWGLVQALTLSQLFLFLIISVYRPNQLGEWINFIPVWLLSIVAVCIGRFGVNVTIQLFRKRGVCRYPVFLISHADDLQKAKTLLRRENRYNLMGWLDISSLEGENWKGTIERIRRSGVSEVFLCPQTPVKNLMFLYWSLRNAGITLHVTSLGVEPFSRKSEFWTLGKMPSTTFAPPLITGSDFWIKRSFDFCCSLLILLLASPIYLGLALLIKLDSPGPIFYRQVRIGLRGRQFKVWKFRTMFVNADKMQKELEAMNQTKDGILFKIKDDPRVTRVGKFIRQYSLDELPQVFNVLVGEMSLVGPRPLPVRDVERFAKHHHIRHEVLPGITGLWQVSGRSDIDDFEDVVGLDITYIENWSLWLDLRILLETVRVVLQKTGAY
jgi:exopolysaccharide biosynthesis polyprenyl glycosylphosphotransferase